MEPTKKVMSVQEMLEKGLDPRTGEALQQSAAVTQPEPIVPKKAPVVNQVLPPQAAAFPSNQMDLLSKFVELMIMKEGREAAKLQREEEAFKARQRQRDRNSRDEDSKQLLKQARCKHLKGGKRGPKTQNKDYAVYQHVFVNSDTYIRCRVCGMRWRPKDTMEYLFRNSRKISNHTKIGWREALGMCDQSTDTISMSERIVHAMSPDFNYAEKQVTATGEEFVPRIVDTDGKSVDNVEL